MYPSFDKEPLAAIDYGMGPAAEPSAPSLPDQMAFLQVQTGSSLMDAPAVSMPSPQLEMQLGPQMMQACPINVMLAQKGCRRKCLQSMPFHACAMLQQ